MHKKMDWRREVIIPYGQFHFSVKLEAYNLVNIKPTIYNIVFLLPYYVFFLI